MDYSTMNTTGAVGLNALSSMPSYGVISVGIVIIGATGLVLLLSYEPLMRKILSFVAFLKRTFGLFFYGLGGSIVLSGLYMFTRFNVNQIKSGNPIFLQYLIGTIVVYAVMTGFGWLIKTFVIDRIRTSYKKATRKLVSKKLTIA